MSEIREVIENGRQNISVNSNDTLRAITAWKLNLNRFLYIFSAGSAKSVQKLLSHFQTEQADPTHIVAPGIHRNVLAGQGSTNVQRHLVSAIPRPQTPEYSPPPRLKPGRLLRNHLEYCGVRLLTFA